MSLRAAALDILRGNIDCEKRMISGDESVRRRADKEMPVAEHRGVSAE